MRKLNIRKLNAGYVVVEVDALHPLVAIHNVAGLLCIMGKDEATALKEAAKKMEAIQIEVAEVIQLIQQQQLKNEIREQ